MYTGPVVAGRHTKYPLSRSHTAVSLITYVAPTDIVRIRLLVRVNQFLYLA